MGFDPSANAYWRRRDMDLAKKAIQRARELMSDFATWEFKHDATRRCWLAQAFTEFVLEDRGEYKIGTGSKPTKPRPEEIALEVFKECDDYWGWAPEGNKQEMIEIIAKAIRAERQRTMPSFEEFRKAEQNLRRKSGKDAPMDAYWAYDWLKEKMK